MPKDAQAVDAAFLRLMLALAAKCEKPGEACGDDGPQRKRGIRRIARLGHA